MSTPRSGTPARRLLRPSWLVMHVLVVVVLYAMFRLGVWQWHRGQETGGLRNYSYALEWWAFVLLTAVGWVKFCLDESAPVQDTPDAPAVVPAGATPPASVDAGADPELAAWNARFAELARRDAETSA